MGVGTRGVVDEGERIAWAACLGASEEEESGENNQSASFGDKLEEATPSFFLLCIFNHH